MRFPVIPLFLLALPFLEIAGFVVVGQQIGLFYTLALVVAAGVLVKGSASSVDLLLVGELAGTRVKTVIKDIESIESRELNYAVLTYDEFYYRLSVRDKFITEILGGKHAVLSDADNILKS